jgi:hypothetical protein
MARVCLGPVMLVVARPAGGLRRGCQVLVLLGSERPVPVALGWRAG